VTRDRERPLRADAERNRRLILQTADRLFAERGSTVTLNDIASAAGVGVGTVYRRFPDPQALIDALFTERFATFHRLAAAAAEETDPGQALRRYLLDAALWRAGDPALEHILANASIDAGPIGQLREDLGHAVDELVERALAAGAVRRDFASADVYTFLFILGAVADRTRDVAPDAWRRYAQILLAGFGLAPDPAPATASMTDDQLRHAWPRPAAPRPKAAAPRRKAVAPGTGRG
jgi:AcrR family transcriptional regulator